MSCLADVFPSHFLCCCEKIFVSRVPLADWATARAADCWWSDDTGSGWGGMVWGVCAHVERSLLVGRSVSLGVFFLTTVSLCVKACAQWSHCPFPSVRCPSVPLLFPSVYAAVRPLVHAQCPLTHSRRDESQYAPLRRQCSGARRRRPRLQQLRQRRRRAAAAAQVRHTHTGTGTGTGTCTRLSALHCQQVRSNVLVCSL